MLRCLGQQSHKGCLVHCSKAGLTVSDYHWLQQSEKVQQYIQTVLFGHYINSFTAQSIYMFLQCDVNIVCDCATIESNPPPPPPSKKTKKTTTKQTNEQKKPLTQSTHCVSVNHTQHCT